MQKPHYIPKDENGNSVDIRKVTPKTNEKCIYCMKCGACIKIRPVQAKYYDDVNYLHYKEKLEINYSHRKEPEIFM